MDIIYAFLRDGMNAIIVIGGIALVVLMFINYAVLTGQKGHIKSAMNWNNKKSVISKSTHEVEDKKEEESVTPDTIRELQTEFYKTCAWHDAYAQLIPIFPLFGILGTVAGLILQLNAQDIDKMFDALGGAMTSTFWGLIAAIILKAIDALIFSRCVNETEILLEDYDKKVNNAVMLGNISE